MKNKHIFPKLNTTISDSDQLQHDVARADRSYSHIGISMREDNSYPLLLESKPSSCAPAPPPPPCTACNSCTCSHIPAASNRSPFSFHLPHNFLFQFQPFPNISFLFPLCLSSPKTTQLNKKKKEELFIKNR